MAKAPKFFAHEQMMAAFEKAGRVSVQEVSIKGIDRSPELQARAIKGGVDMDHVRKLGEALKIQGSLAPVVIFVVGKKYILANGFHRTTAYEKDGRRSINAIVIKGATMQEAVEYAACCNVSMSLAMTMEDKKKAAFLLLDNGWISKSAAETGRHIGISDITAMKWILEYCDLRGCRRPEKTVAADGRTVSNRPKSGRSICSDRGRKFLAMVNGSKITGKTFAEAESKVSEALGLESRNRERLQADRFGAEMAVRRIHYSPAKGGSLRRMAVGVCRGRAVAPCPDFEPGAKGLSHLIEAIGRAVIAGEILHSPRRVVITPVPVNGWLDVVSAASRLGVDVMTLDEFADLVASDQEVPSECLPKSKAASGQHAHA